MNRSFSIILNFTLHHDYYTNNLCPDFMIVPTAATARFLKRNRLIFQNTTYGFLIGCDNITMAMIPQILAYTTLGFMLKLKNSSFMNFTDFSGFSMDFKDLPPRSGGRDIYYLSPRDEDHSLIVPLYPQVCTHSFIAAGDTTNIQVVDPGGNIVLSETYTGTVGQQVNFPMNFTQHMPGLYQFMVEGAPNYSIYVTDESLVNGIFGLAEITLGDFAGFDPETYQPVQYQYQFTARSSIWEYHVSFRRTYSIDAFLLIDTTLGSYNEITDDREESAPPYYPVGSSTVFISPEPVPYQEAARTSVELLITIDEGIETLENLPAPSVNNPESKVYLTI